MRLALKDIATLFDVSESTVHKWIRYRELPSRSVRGNLAFDRMKVLEWATVTGKRVSPDIVDTLCDPESCPSLVDALTVGGVHYGIVGEDMRAVFASIIGVLNLPDDAERDLLRRVLLARKSLGLVRIDDGVVIPHPRSPIVSNTSESSVSLCFLEKPIKWTAADGALVNMIFTIITSSIHSHLYLLSRLAYILHDAKLRAALDPKAKPKRILELVRKAEADISPKAKPKRVLELVRKAEADIAL
jgi:nitrogen PTS system EIIA component